MSNNIVSAEVQAAYKRIETLVEDMNGDIALPLAYSLVYSQKIADETERAEAIKTAEWCRDFMFEGRPGLQSFMTRPKKDATEAEIVEWIRFTVDELRLSAPWFATQILYRTIMAEDLWAVVTEDDEPVSEDIDTYVTSLVAEDGEVVRQVLTLGHPHLDVGAALVASGIAEVDETGDLTQGELPLKPRFAI